ncbi:hypothetical protein [Kiritimatiella glycovorans]|uniref:Uncharacterized protein n=1 Tax=Kiritimatiella glycovorans TaxID=1307763 RepID=A0A0G3EAY1_9BACT|nr:hypothetical protein [Kiritimatiella glycovorans]AKJ63428.1 hypothetical protein L21SP4_00143 [Kiritimatiella glycovorans]
MKPLSLFAAVAGPWLVGGVAQGAGCEAVTKLAIEVYPRADGSVRTVLRSPAPDLEPCDLFVSRDLQSWCLDGERLPLGGTARIARVHFADPGEAVFYAAALWDADADADLVPDGREVYLYGTAASRTDTDGDGLDDGEELYGRRTDPCNADAVSPLVTIHAPADNAVYIRQP